MQNKLRHYVHTSRIESFVYQISDNDWATSPGIVDDQTYIKRVQSVQAGIPGWRPSIYLI